MGNPNLLLIALIAGLLSGSALPALPGREACGLLLAFDLFLLLLYLRLRRPVIAAYIRGSSTRNNSLRIRLRRGLLAAGVWLAGLLWSVQAGHDWQQHRLPDELAGQDMVVQGTVINLPEPGERGERFDFAVDALPVDNVSANTLALRKLRLTSYEQRGHEPEWRYRPGERWQLLVRLKPPRGMVNPDSFDYEGWLLQQGYGATGYVRDSPLNRQLDASSAWNALRIKVMFDRWGFASLLWIRDRIDNPDRRALFAAIALGYTEEFTRHHWELLKDTGTIHLVVVSGLNIVLAATTGFLLFAALARILVLPLRCMPLPLWCAIGAMLVAVSYAGMTGFSLPTQRSLVMVLCGLATVLLRRHIAVATGFLLALASVLLLDPLAGFTASLWLSFGAVAILLYCFAARIQPAPAASWWQRVVRGQWVSLWLRTQAAVSVGLFPVISCWMGSAPLVSPLANLFAVPWATFVLLPLAILCGIADAISPLLGKPMLALCGYGMDLFWYFLAVMQRININMFAVSGVVPVLVVLLLATIAVLVLFAPRGIFLSRWRQAVCATVLLLPWLLPVVDHIPPGEFRLTMLDVGQGLGVLVETADGVLVYDTGDRFSDRFDTGRELVATQLHRRGYRVVDTLVVSHNDSDHAGGAPGLLSAMPVHRILSGNAQLVQQRLVIANPDTPYRVLPCEAGQQWQSGGVQFTVLAPEPGSMAVQRNNDSCVLRVSAQSGSALLAGDIETEREQWLVQQYGAELHARVLVAPHHGSKTSSGAGFLDAVQPQLALASVGYHNQYGHPHAQASERYRQAGIRLLRTDWSGAVSVQPGPGGLRIRQQRMRANGYWHRWQDGFARIAPDSR